MAINLEASGNPIPSWNDTDTRQAIVEFVESVTGDGPNHISVEERVAVFDNDGTLWCEQPMPIQLDFLVRRMGEMASEDPALLDQQPWKAVAAKNYGWLSGALIKHYRGDDTDLRVLVGGLLRAYEGRPIEELEAAAATSCGPSARSCTTSPPSASWAARQPWSIERSAM
jgi:hypothetical protein